MPRERAQRWIFPDRHGTRTPTKQLSPMKNDDICLNIGYQGSRLLASDLALPRRRCARPMVVK
jgi:hypothetical protein